MGFCVKHWQTYSEKLGGFCTHCGNPEHSIKTSGTGQPPAIPMVKIGDEVVNVINNLEPVELESMRNSLLFDLAWLTFSSKVTADEWQLFSKMWSDILSIKGR